MELIIMKEQYFSNLYSNRENNSRIKILKDIIEPFYKDIPLNIAVLLEDNFHYMSGYFNTTSCFTRNAEIPEQDPNIILSELYNSLTFVLPEHSGLAHSTDLVVPLSFYDFSDQEMQKSYIDIGYLNTRSKLALASFVHKFILCCAYVSSMINSRSYRSNIDDILVWCNAEIKNQMMKSLSMALLSGNQNYIDEIKEISKKILFNVNSYSFLTHEYIAPYRSDSNLSDHTVEFLKEIRNS